jgi:antitoxin component YwqK of YwqJK toxin-antitoxin module
MNSNSLRQILVLFLIIPLSKVNFAQSNSSKRINAPGIFNFNTANSIVGNRTRFERDSDADGTADQIYTYTYDANGNPTRYEYDADADGTADQIETSTYDANGNLIRSEYDYDADGTADQIYRYTYDANGNLTREEYDYDADGTVDEIDTYTYDANGNLTRYENDYDADGTEDEIEKFTYDANGNQTRSEYDADADGTTDEISTYTYDANGNQIRREGDSDADGTVDNIITYDYFNTVLCPDLAKGLVHKLTVDIPESGVWRFSLCGSDFQNVLALSSTEHCDSNLFYANNGCFNDDATADVRLEEAGTYYLTVAGRWNKDNGNYNLEITRLQGLDVPSIKENLLSIYPNPAKDHITVNSSVKMDSYQIFNALGEKVLSGNLTNPTIQTESLHSGSYFIVLEETSTHLTYRKKFIK